MRLDDLFAVVLLFGSAASSAHPHSKPAASPQPSPIVTATQSAGERIFHNRCSQCHNAPESFSPRISGTIVRHMRVRATLSQSEEQDLLRFLNP